MIIENIAANQLPGVQHEGRVIKNTAFAKGQAAFCGWMGRGETVAQYIIDQRKLGRLLELPQATAEVNSAIISRFFNVSLKYAPVKLFDKLKINLATVAAYDTYSKGEIQSSIALAKSLQPAKIYGLAHSMGWYGFANAAAKDPSILDSLDALVAIAPGPGDLAAAKFIAQRKIPVWFLVTDTDNTAGRLDTYSKQFHEAILAAGGTSYLTVYDKTNPIIVKYGVHPILAWVTQAWGSDGAPEVVSSQGYKAIAGNMRESTLNVFEWPTCNERGGIPVAPDGNYKPVIVEDSNAEIPGDTTGGGTTDPTTPTDPQPPPPATKRVFFKDFTNTGLGIDKTKAGSPWAMLEWEDGSGVVQIDKPGFTVQYQQLKFHAGFKKWGLSVRYKNNIEGAAGVSEYFLFKTVPA